MAEPTRVMGLAAVRGTSQIALTWAAPLMPHGDVTHYVVRWRQQQLLQLRERYRLRDYCQQRSQ